MESYSVIQCARAIMVDAVLARQHLKALAEYYDEYYVSLDGYKHTRVHHLTHKFS